MFSKRSVALRKERVKVVTQKRVKKKQTCDMYINGIVWQPPQLCEFCEQRQAVLHCPECDTNGNNEGDFLCEECDLEVHRHLKRAGHVRTLLPGVTADTAALRLLGLLRFASCRRQLLERCRARVTRYYDPATKRYYYNDSWLPPRCLKGQPLTPFPNFEVCAMRIQNSFRYRQGRFLLIQLIRELYDKIWSREHTRFYYHFNGASSLIARVSWQKPRHLYWRQLKPYKNVDVAALLIQAQWKCFRARQFVLALVRSSYDAAKDPVTGRFIYTRNGVKSTAKPPLLKNDEWDPEDISLWDVHTTWIWLRRLGFRDLPLHKFNIDGALILAFEWDDFVDLGIRHSHHIKRILLDIEKRRFFPLHKDMAVTLARLDRLRYHHKIEAACLVIQRRYRKRYKRILASRLKHAARLVHDSAKRDALLRDGQLWWARKLPPIVPDRGKLFGNHRLVLGVRGRGAFQFISSTTSWIASQPLPQLDVDCPSHLLKANKAVAAARTLRFRRHPDATLQRDKFFHKLKHDSLTAAASRATTT